MNANGDLGEHPLVPDSLRSPCGEHEPREAEEELTASHVVNTTLPK